MVERNEELWFGIRFGGVRIRDVWEDGRMERRMEFWSENGGDHVILDYGRQTCPSSNRGPLLKCNSFTAKVNVAIGMDVFTAAFEQVRDLVEEGIIPA